MAARSCFYNFVRGRKAPLAAGTKTRLSDVRDIFFFFANCDRDQTRCFDDLQIVAIFFYSEVCCSDDLTATNFWPSPHAPFNSISSVD